MKKKIIFMVINMNIGGTEKALLNMISELPQEYFDVTILMLEEYGGFLDLIPSHVNIEKVDGYRDIQNIYNNPPKLSAIRLIKKGNVLKAFNILFFHLFSKVFKDRKPFLKYILKDHPINNNKYDLAVAYAGPMDLITYFVLNKIVAKKKFQWIHFDVTKIGFNKTVESKMYNKFDKIFVVSEDGRNKLINMIPSIDKKTEVFSNITSPELIYRQSKEGKGYTDSFDGVRILTIGRLTNEKGQDMAIKALSMLIKEGYKVRWYCLGEGSSREKYEKLVEEYNLQNQFVFLGVDPNPYPYIAQCDIYVQPSRHEGYCITLAEARCFKKPIVTTDTIGAKEQIKNGETGLIVGANEFELYYAVIKLINNQNLRNSFTQNLEKEHINTVDMNKLCKLII